jgi:transposase-like protein
MKVNPSQFSEITEKYSAGVGSRQLATEYGVSAATINRVVRQTTGVSRVRLTDSQCLEVSSQYESGRSMTEIATTFSVYASTISRLLQKVGVRKPSESGRKKGGFTPEEKESIIDLYVNQHRGKEYIATLYGRSDANVSYWLEKWKIDTTPRSEIMTTIRQVYGPTTGFNGRLHSTSSKAEIASSMRADWQRGTRLPNIGKSRMYDTVVGRV